MIQFCAISYWEIAMLRGKYRIRFNQSIGTFCKNVQAFRNYKIIDITPKIANIARNYAHLINGDPADRLIAASAISEDAHLLTLDQNLLSLPFLNTI